jgi:tryptophan-rich sensory protein
MQRLSSFSSSVDSTTSSSQINILVESVKSPIDNRGYQRWKDGKNGDDDLESQLYRYQYVKKLPAKKDRQSYWKYEIIRPWEIHPPMNYFELLHKENPWTMNPPSNNWLIAVLCTLILLNFASAFGTILVNHKIWTQRVEMIGQLPAYLLPYWFLILMDVVAQFGNSFAAWFIYLTGGLKKIWKSLICYFLMIACGFLWPDILFHARSFSGAAIVTMIALIACLVNIITFSYHMIFAGCLLIFQLFILSYQVSVLISLWIMNGSFIK